MANHSLYRKYRPQTFADVVGQEHIEQTLRNALANDRVSHAYLFCGPRGTGKTTTARLLAKALLCDQAPTANPDGVCENCVDIAEGLHPDVYELDAASRTGVDNVREEIIGRVAFSPTRGRYKVYIIDEVHMLSTAAFNALLKTLEEPPAHVVFVLCTTDPQKVPATIISRCQRFDFHSLSTEQITECLQNICEGEGFRFEPAALELIAKQARGGMRDAITALEQVAVFGNGSVGYAAAENMFGDVGSIEMADIVDLVIARDVAGCFRWVDSFVQGGIDVAQVARSLTSYIRNLYVSMLPGGERALPPMDAQTRARLVEQAGRVASPDRAASMLMVLGDLATDLRTSVDARLSLEVALTRLAHPASDLTLEALAARIDALERGAAASPAPAASAAPVVSFEPPASAVADSATAATARVVDAAPAAVQAETPVAAAAAAAVASAASAGVAAPAPTASDPAPAAASQPASAQPQVSRSDEEILRHAVTLLKDPASLRRLWDIAVRNLGKSHPAATSLMGGARPHADLKHSRIVVELPHDADFAQGLLSRPDTKQEMINELQNLFGVKLGLDYVLGEPAEDELSATAPAATSVEVQAPEPALIAEPEPAVEPVLAVALAPDPTPVVEPVPVEAAPAPAVEAAPAPVHAVPEEPAFESVPLSAYEDFGSAAPESVSAAPVEQERWNDSPAPQDAATAVPAEDAVAAPATASVPVEPLGAASDQGAAAPDIPADVPADTADLFRSVFGDGVVFRGSEE